MNILVTGSAGFLGSHTAESLMRDGNAIAGIDNRSMGVDFTPKGLAFDDKGYIEDLLPMSDVPEEWPVDVLVHAAARADVQYNWANQIERMRLQSSNVDGTLALLEEGNRVAKKPSIVFISTCAVYGDDMVCQEDRALIATSPYAASKIAGEAMVQAYATAWDVKWHILRLSCMVGPRYHHGHIKDFIDMAQTGKVTPKNDGIAKKSFVHVLDVVDAIGMCARGEIPSGVYNVSSGTWSPRDTIRAMGVDAITEWPYAKRHGWVGDPIAVASSNKLRAAGWISKRTIEAGVRESLDSLGWAK